MTRSLPVSAVIYTVIYPCFLEEKLMCPKTVKELFVKFCCSLFQTDLLLLIYFVIDPDIMVKYS